MAESIKKFVSWEQINAFPIKNKDMSVQELRQLCVDFLRFAKRARWVCKQDVDYTYGKKGRPNAMKGGQVYGGLPYIGLATGNVYRLLDYMDENGVVDLSPVINRKAFNKRYSWTLFRNFGNQCANGAYVGWGRVINSAKYRGTPTMVLKNGFLRLGEYKYPDDLEVYTKDYNTVAICQENGEQAMFRSYAKLQLGDGLVNFTTAGHVIMCTVAPKVVYNEDGSINGEESTICITEQGVSWKEETDEEGESFLMAKSVDAQRTFSKLFEKGYLPFTFAEFQGTHPVEDTVCTIDLEGPEITAKELFSATIRCNYGIMDAYAIITDDQGNQVYKHAVRSVHSGTTEMKLLRKAEDPQDFNNVEHWGEYPFPGTYNIKIEAQLATGERPTLYEGRFVMPEAKVEKPLNREQLDAFPIKSKDMSVQELRQLCVDFFRFSKQIRWTSKQNVDYIRNAAGSQDGMRIGRVYGGFPYIGLATGNPYRMLDYIDPVTGEVDFAPIIKKKKFNKVYVRDLFRNFGNQCANGAYVGWGRVINSADYSGSPSMLVANGFPRVGEYKYPDDLEVLRKTYNSVAICQENGEQVMFRSYAQMQIGDGLNNFTTAGHVVMCTGAPEIVYNADGTINGESSYLRITEQAQTWTEQLTAEGQDFLMKPSVDAKWTFNKLFTGGYLPFTFAEFQGTHPVEDTVCTIDLTGEAVTAKELFNATIRSNYGIFDAYAYVTNDQGEEVYRHAVRCLRSGCKALEFVKRAKDKDDHDNVEVWGEFPLPGSYGVKVEAQLATGERFTVYEGKLIVPKAYVHDPLTWDKINAFPIKYKGMPVAERRQLVVDFFRFQKRVNWTPKECLDYVKNPHGAPDKMYEGTVYRGFPYVTVGSGNVYRMMDFIDEDGYIDIKRAASPARKFGNQCAAGVFGGWGRLVNSPEYSFTVSMTIKNGFYPVGPYTYDPEQPRFGAEYPSTYDICEKNGEQVMFQSYGAMEIGDVMVNYRTAGHIIMCTIAPVVVYNEDGSINGEESYLHITDQAQTWLPGYEENGDDYLYKNNIDWKRTFNQLLAGGYLPMTVPELTGEKDIDDTEVSVNLTGDTVTWEQVMGAEVTANFGITDVYAVVTDEKGKELYKHATRADINNRRSVAIGYDENFVDTWGELPAAGKYDLKVLVQLYTGERLTVYTGKLIVE